MKKNTVKKDLPLGLYIHIPFCRSKCAYCDFYSLAGAEERMDDYCRALERHLAEVAPQAECHKADTVYFGGGTPSYLGAERLCRLLGSIRKLYKVDKHAEITLEANPDSATDRKTLKRLRKAGFNRLSLGVQSMDDALLQAIGRIHTRQQVQEAVAAARKAGFKNLSLDLIYGLPGQTMEGWEKTLSDAVGLLPEHLSCYGLKLEEGTPLYERRAELTLPDEEQQADMYLYAVEFLKQCGYNYKNGYIFMEDITEDEYEEQKQRCIAEIFSPYSGMDEFKKRVNNLLTLHKAGMLTEEEFVSYKTKLMSDL